ncbi:hypothetical protein I4U23_015653 [Adineta vaga]|nr:hypothetical protein I4U23_015653 [Adineta vaga]
MAFDNNRSNIDSVERMIHSNRTIQQSTYSIISQFCNLQQQFAHDLASVYNNLSTLKDVVNIFLDADKLTTLKQYKIKNKIELIVCGKKSSGKTSFIQQLLGCGSFLPIGSGNVSQRSVKFSYAPIDKACLFVHGKNEQSYLLAKRIHLSSSLFRTDVHSQELKKTIEPYLFCGENAIESDEWLSCLIEISIPSRFLQSNIEIYDVVSTTDMINIHVQNPCFLFLYDGTTISDETQKYYEHLQLTIGDKIHNNLFFLNTKVDQNDILNNDSIDGILHRERNRRYEHLRNVFTLHNQLPRTLAECDRFDIFSIEPIEHPITQIIQQNAITRIVRFAFEHALRQTQQVSTIMLDAIDGFFDFVLITNRRSLNEWNMLRDEALHWADEFFQEYRLQIDMIGDEVQKQLLKRFHQQRKRLAEKMLAYKIECCEELNLQVSSISLINAIQPIEISNENNFSQLLIQENIVRPILSRIFDQISHRVNEKVDRNVLVKGTTRINELIRAAYREFLNHINIIDNHKHRREYFKKISFKEILAGISGFMNTLGTIFSITEFDIDNLDKHDNDKEIEKSFMKIGECIKRNIQNEIEVNERFFKEKIHAYHQIVLTTMNVRQQAYRLARSFAARFARIECLLSANLDAIKHYGTIPTIDLGTTLAHGGFFSIHPALWDSEQDLVAKVLLQSNRSLDMAYMEAHFHRAITRLNIEHIVPLRSLYYDDQTNHLYILLRRYPMSLHTYLTDHMADLTMNDAVRILLHISRAISHLHAHNLIHRDIKTRNILLDNNKNVYLADFGTCQHGTENSTIIGSLPLPPELNHARTLTDFSYEGTAVDVFSLGLLIYIVAPKAVYHDPQNIITGADIHALIHLPQRYRTLIINCIHANPKLRPTADKVVEQLELIANQVAKAKECLMCFEYPIFSRCLPCGHKTVCAKCLTQQQQRATPQNPPQCILCRQTIINSQEDIDNSTFAQDHS